MAHRVLKLLAAGAVGAGATVLCGNARAEADDLVAARSLFESVGAAWETRDEALLDAVTGLSGSGPAYVFRFLEVLAEAGEHVGLPRELSESLAEQTGKATSQIAQHIHSIQSATDEAVDSIKGISESVRSMDTIASTVAAAVEEQGAATNEIAQNVQSAATGTTEVANNITGVNKAAEETGASSSEVLSASSELAVQADNLNRGIDGFLEKIRAA